MHAGLHSDVRLSIGAGSHRTPGWLHIDREILHRPDVVADVLDGLPVRRARLIHAEHFVEHLGLRGTIQFVREARRVLESDGIFRLSTPDLDWIYLTHYADPKTLSQGEAERGCLEMNRAFHGWGHKFSFNYAFLKALLEAGGFANVRRESYGRSSVPDLSGLEQHEKGADGPETEHVVVVEAFGISDVDEDYFRSLGGYLADLDAGF